MRAEGISVVDVGGAVGRRTGPVAAILLLLWLWGPALAQEMCQKKMLDPRSARLQVRDIQASRNQITGKVKNSSGETATGVMVWLSYYVGRRGGLMAQQCIPVGDLQPGEERTFLGVTAPEAEKAESYDYSADAVGWK